MKIKFYSLPVCILVTLSLVFASCGSTTEAGGNAASSEDVVKAINNDHWVFVANQVSPQRGRTRVVNGNYQVECKGDTLVSYLPYFGRAFSATYGDNTSALDFTSTNFGYTKQKNSKGAWEVTIKPADNKEVRSMFFTIYENGSAQLSVICTNRDPINFSGTVNKK